MFLKLRVLSKLCGSLSEKPADHVSGTGAGKPESSAGDQERETPSAGYKANEDGKTGEFSLGSTCYICLSVTGDRLHCQVNINMGVILIKAEGIKYEIECFHLDLRSLGQSVELLSRSCLFSSVDLLLICA